MSSKLAGKVAVVTVLPRASGLVSRSKAVEGASVIT